jgi:3-oxoacyl-[acyl-carrier protein] reductase
MKESVAIVSGASQGIGRATAIRLAKNFSGVVLAARDGKALEETAGGVKANGANPLTAELDLRSRESAETLIKQTLDRFGRIDALVNIAGAVPQIDLFEMTDAQWQDGMELKPWAVLLGHFMAKEWLDLTRLLSAQSSIVA